MDQSLEIISYKQFPSSFPVSCLHEPMFSAYLLVCAVCSHPLTALHLFNSLHSGSNHTLYFFFFFTNPSL